MAIDEQEIVGRWNVSFRGRTGSWKWEYTFFADRTLKWRDPLNGLEGSGRWVKQGKLINISWNSTNTKESWTCPINPPDQKGWIDASYGVGPFQAAKIKEVDLDFRTISLGRRFGDYNWQVQFILNNASASTNGFIVQKVTFRSDTTTCDGNPTNDSAVWWEAWQVRDGKVLAAGSSTELSLGDQFTSSNTMGTKGKISHTGETKYMPNYVEPLTWGKFKMAGSLPATQSQPPGWSSDGVLQRSIAVEYDSCQNPPWEGPMSRQPQK